MIVRSVPLVRHRLRLTIRLGGLSEFCSNLNGTYYCEQAPGQCYWFYGHEDVGPIIAYISPVIEPDYVLTVIIWGDIGSGIGGVLAKWTIDLGSGAKPACDEIDADLDLVSSYHCGTSPTCHVTAYTAPSPSPGL